MGVGEGRRTARRVEEEREGEAVGGEGRGEGEERSIAWVGKEAFEVFMPASVRLAGRLVCSSNVLSAFFHRRPC